MRSSTHECRFVERSGRARCRMMPSDGDELREGFSAWHIDTDGVEAFARVSAKRRRRRTIRRLQISMLAITVVAGTTTGTYALAKVFREPVPNHTPLVGPSPPSVVANRIAFVSDRDGNDEIYSMRPDGSDVLRLTNDPGHDLQPAWSPDARQIAFISDRGGSYQIWVM